MTDSDRSDHAFTAEETCMNCQAEDTIAMHAETGQYIGSWCENCGVLNQSNGLYQSPDRDAVPIGVLENLVDDWRSGAPTREMHRGKLGCADRLQEVIEKHD